MNLKQADLGVSDVLDNVEIAPKVLQVKAAHFNGLKITIAIVVCIAIGLAFVLKKIKDDSDQKALENSKLMSQVSALKGQVDETVDKLEAVSASNDSNNTKALSYIEGIQGKLKKINDYLGKRGLKGVTFREMAVAKSTTKKNANLDVYAKYNHYLEQLVTNVAMVPMGYPRLSSFTSFFGYRGNPFDFGRSEFHPGLDFKGHVGDPVKCTASGTVVFTGRAGGYGNCIRIQHMGNVQTWYGHLSHFDVHVGEHVTAGQLIGRVGSTGRSTGPHLHYEVRRNGKPVNPAQYLSLAE